MPRTWSRWTPTHAALVIRELNASGLTLAEFARRRGLCVQRLRRWRDRLEVTAGPRVIELVPSAPAAPADPLGAMRIHCPTGHVIDLYQGDVLTVLRALAEVAC